MMKRTEVIQKAKEVLRDIKTHHDAALLVTTSKDGHPHACWMGTVGQQEFDTIVTMVTLNSQKIKDITENPRVEWVFVDVSENKIVRFKGKAKILRNVVEIADGMKHLYSLPKAYILEFLCENSMFVMVETKIEEMEYSELRNKVYEHIQIKSMVEKCAA